MSAPATLEFDSVTKRYPGAATPVIDDLTFDVPAGEICVLVGPSGCGKTTAMRMVNRMVDITAGDIRIGGTSVLERSPAQLRREIGYVIQQVGLFPHQTVAENVAAVPRLLGWDRSRIRTRVAELLELVGLDPALGSRYPAQLSGGQRQRVGVARALAVDPPLMLMDEPFGAIDPINRERLQNEFLRLQGRLRKTVVFVTHDIDEAIKMGDRIAVMQTGGRLAQYATPAELLVDPADAFVEDFVGADRALKRLALLRVRDVDLWRAPLVRAGDSSASARARAAESEVPYPLLVDDDGRPLGWLSERDLARPIVTPPADSAPDPIIDADDVLRDALAELLQAGTQYAPVVDPRGAVLGVLSVEIVSDLLAAGSTAQEAPADRVRDDR
ncbi:MAG TPA: ABC transporter ATP-binding protein [Capillimicrobium sp.]|nr:ABC transporter ATP-binding protein [Capillimicrobium sp.]